MKILFLVLIIFKIFHITNSINYNSYSYNKIIINDNNNNNAILSYNSNNKNNIGCQIHSWNDLNEFDQMYKKGVVWNKIDVHYMKDLKFCESQNLNDTRGCFVLSHDIPYYKIQYNNSVELKDYLVSRKDIWYSNSNGSSTTKFIALCFKARILVCSNGNITNDYLDMVHEFIESLITIKSKYSLNVEFIIDGIIKPIGCLKDKWRSLGLVSTWIDQPIPALFSNDQQFGYDQFQVADIYIDLMFPSLWVNALCLISPPFGKFTRLKQQQIQNNDNSTYSLPLFPILVWEPSSQHDIESVSTSYRSCIDKHLTYEFPELRFASNIDPVQLSLYSGSISNKTWNFKINHMGLINSKSNINNASSSSSSSPSNSIESDINPKIVSFNNFFLILFSNRSKSSPPPRLSSTNDYSKYDLYYHLFYSNQVLGNLNYIQTFKFKIPNDSLFKSSAVNSIKVIDNMNLLILFDNFSNYLIYKLNDNKELIVSTFGYLSENNNETIIRNTYDIQITTATSINTSITIIEYYSSNLCYLKTRIWKLSSFKNESELLLESCLISRNSAVGVIESISVVTKDNQSILFYSTYPNKEIIVSNIRIDIENKVEIKILYQKQLDVGQQISVSIIDDLVMQVHSEGYCYNTEINNKRNDIKVCDQLPISTPKILNYNFGTFNQWLLKINQTSSLITSCDNLLIHGTYNQGSNPNVLLYKQQQKVGVVEVHQGLPLDFIDYSNCGRATSCANNEIVLNSWKLFPELLNKL